MNKKIKVILIVILLFATILILGSFFCLYTKSKQEKILKDEVVDIKSHYGNYVKVIKTSNLYIKDKDKFVSIGSVSKDYKFTLKKQKINKDTKYFQIDDLDYYIKYDDVVKTDSIDNFDQRYKRYLLFNENVVTNDKFSLYRGDNLVFSFNKGFSFPIILKDDLGFYVEYNNELLFIKKEDVLRIDESSNTSEEAATSIATTVYHFIYLEGDTSCNESICHSEKQVRSHFDYLKENNFFTMNTHEMELFIDGKIRLPKKSILITIDDGSRAEKFIPILEEYKINATLFLITSWYDKSNFLSNYLEVASHGNDLHNPGKCPGGQGGPIKCMDHDLLLQDLKTTREKLDGTTAFCYPFYEFNDYAIKALKESGFTIAFIGGMKKVTPGIDKFKTPRISLNNTTTVSEYANYIN